MIKVVLGGLVALFLLGVLGVFGWLAPVLDGMHRLFYGQPLAHPNGDAGQRINDWLTFLPADTNTRGLVVVGFGIALMVLVILYGLFSFRWQHWRRDVAAREEARRQTLQAYNSQMNRH